MMKTRTLITGGLAAIAAAALLAWAFAPRPLAVEVAQAAKGVMCALLEECALRIGERGNRAHGVRVIEGQGG